MAKSDEAVAYLRAYRGTHDFLLTMQGLLFQGRSLSEKQATAILKFRAYDHAPRRERRRRAS